MVNIVLRHIHKMVVCYPVFPKLTKVFLKVGLSLMVMMVVVMLMVVMMVVV